MSDGKAGVFISHISHEKPVALKLQEYVKNAFGAEFPVFVSSDQTSIGGGRKWFEYILSNLRTAKVVLVLVSQESCYREWINSETGFGDGAGACVIPVAIKTFTFEQLRYPLSGFNGRYIADLEGIFHDIRRETGLVAERVDTGQYRDDIAEAEASLIYKSIIVTPGFARMPETNICFTVRNTGNTDLDLILFEAWVPVELVERNLESWYRPVVPNLVRYERTTIDDRCYWHGHYFAAIVPNNYQIEGLRPVLTPSMGKIQLAHPRFRVTTQEIPDEDQARHIVYHLHARNFTTARALLFPNFNSMARVRVNLKLQVHDFAVTVAS